MEFAYRLKNDEGAILAIGELVIFVLAQRTEMDSRW